MRRIVFACLLLAAAMAPFGPALAAEAGGFVPAVLTPADVARYRQIIAAERAGQFDKAKRLTAKLEDRSLIGYIEAEHLLSRHSGRAKVATLVKWLKSYSDLPIAKRVRKLTVKRASKKVYRRRGHRRRLVTVMTRQIPGLPSARLRGGGYEEFESAEPPVQSDAARAVQEQISRGIRAGDPDAANAALQSLIAGGRAPIGDIARLSRKVCTSYLIEGKDEAAFALGRAAAETGRKEAPLLDWCVGLAAFRMKRYDDGARHFDILAGVSDEPAAMRAAAAFWAGRAHFRAGRPERLIGYLQQAAANRPTFYGLLAERILGMDEETGFADPVLAPADFDRMIQNEPTRRAIALWQIDEKKYAFYAEKELNRGFGQSANHGLDAAYAALARRIGAPNIELRASELMAARGMLLTGLFPIPIYKPSGGYTIDPALVLAIVRIETRFQAGAVSPVGAVGLMQLMPSTARGIGGKAATEKALLDPAYNMSLGQRYVARQLDRFDGNLIKLGAAYNAGPGKVYQWASLREGKEDDALMFIESMQAPETRNYVKKLLAYYWMYHRRNGHSAPSLDETAAGNWPNYHAPAQSAPPPPPDQSDEDEEDGEEEVTPVS